MDSSLEKIIKDKLSHLVTFILEKYPNANKDQIDLKISELLCGANTPLQSSLNPTCLKGSKVKTLPKKHIVKKDIISHNIFDSIQKQNLIIKVKKSQYSNYIVFVDSSNPEFNDLNQSKLILIPSTKVIIGFEGLNGQIESLNKDLIEICHRYKLRFEMPLNLNINDAEDSVIADEMQGLGLNIADSDGDSEDEE